MSYQKTNRANMQNFKQLAKNVISVIAILFLWGCGSSAEYTTAKMAIQDEEWEKAEEFLFKALEVEPANAEVMVQIGYHVHAKKEQWIEMNKIFNFALEANPEAKINSRPISEVIKNYRNMFWAENYNKSVRTYNDYKNSKDKKILQKAIDRFEQTVNIDPNEGQTYSILSTSYYELGNNDKAIEIGKKAVELMPNEFQPNMALGQILSFSGDKQGSLKYIEKAIEIAAFLAKIEDYRIVSLPKQKDPFTEIALKLGATSISDIVMQKLGLNTELMKPIENLLKEDKIQARIPFIIELK